MSYPGPIHFQADLIWLGGTFKPQSIQSAKLFLQSSELGFPHPLTRSRVCPSPPLVPGGGAHSLAGEGVGESQFRRGTYTVVLFNHVLCALNKLSLFCYIWSG